MQGKDRLRKTIAMLGAWSRAAGLRRAQVWLGEGATCFPDKGGRKQVVENLDWLGSTCFVCYRILVSRGCRLPDAPPPPQAEYEQHPSPAHKPQVMPNCLQPRVRTPERSPHGPTACQSHSPPLAPTPAGSISTCPPATLIRAPPPPGSLLQSPQLNRVLWHATL